MVEYLAAMAQISKQARERVRAHSGDGAELTLAELRKAFDVSQEELASLFPQSSERSR